MKAAFFLLACACLMSGLNASFFEDEETNFDNEISPQLNILFPDDANAHNPIVPFPTTTRRPFPTTSTTTRRPFPTTTTRRPFPTTTTRRPFPPTKRPNPGLERIQIYNNAVRSMGPLAGRLINVVLNRGKSQKTMQKNDILYNMRMMSGNRRTLEETSEY